MVRVGPDQHDEALTRPYARAMDFTGRPMKGFVYVDQEGLASDDELDAWLQRGLSFALSLPAK